MIRNSYNKSQRKHAIKAMQTLGFKSEYIETFKTFDFPILFELGGTPSFISLKQNKDIYDHIRKVENKFKCLVYAVISSQNEKSYTFLVVSGDSTDWGDEVYDSTVYGFTYYPKNFDASGYGCVQVTMENGNIINIGEKDYFPYIYYREVI